MPKIVGKAVKEYECSDQNKIRSMRVLYEGGLVSSRKYTKIRNGCDGVKGAGKKRPAKFMSGCAISKYVPYKALITYIKKH